MKPVHPSGHYQGPPHSPQIVSPANCSSATKQDKFRKNVDSLVVSISRIPFEGSLNPSDGKSGPHQSPEILKGVEQTGVVNFCLLYRIHEVLAWFFCHIS